MTKAINLEYAYCQEIRIRQNRVNPAGGFQHEAQLDFIIEDENHMVIKPHYGATLVLGTSESMLTVAEITANFKKSWCDAIAEKIADVKKQEVDYPEDE